MPDTLTMKALVPLWFDGQDHLAGSLFKADPTYADILTCLHWAERAAAATVPPPAKRTKK